MKSGLRILILLVLVPLIDIAGTAQEPDARTVLQAALKAMGGENLRSVQYSGSEGYVAAVGQNYNPAADWPAPSITTYTRTIDYEARSSREEYGLTTSTGQGGPLGGGNAPVITTPIVGEQRRNWIVRENIAWNVDGTNVVPQPALAETAAARDLADAARLPQGGAGAGRQPDRRRAHRAEQGAHRRGVVPGARASTACSARSTARTWWSASRRGFPIRSSATCTTSSSTATTRTSTA